MKIEQTKPIDCLYLSWLEEVADYYEEDLNETMKHIIWKEWREVHLWKEMQKTDENCIQQTFMGTNN